MNFFSETLEEPEKLCPDHAGTLATFMISESQAQSRGQLWVEQKYDDNALLSISHLSLSFSL